jgi:hypothetical protein
MSLIFPEMFLRSNIDNDATDTINATVLSNFLIHRICMCIMYIDFYIQ